MNAFLDVAPLCDPIDSKSFNTLSDSGPSISPKTTCLPSNHGHGTVVIKTRC